MTRVREPRAGCAAGEGVCGAPGVRVSLSVRVFVSLEAVRAGSS